MSLGMHICSELKELLLIKGDEVLYLEKNVDYLTGGRGKYVTSIRLSIEY